MNDIHKRRAYWLVTSVLSLFIVVALVLYALRSNINLFYTPTQVQEGLAPQDTIIRVGGLVVNHSIKRNGLDIEFALTDTARSITVKYRGLLPDLFREGQGVVVMGKADREHTFHATQLLARHDENYMPPEVSDAVKQQFQKIIKDNPEKNDR